MEDLEHGRYKRSKSSRALERLLHPRTFTIDKTLHSYYSYYQSSPLPRRVVMAYAMDEVRFLFFSIFSCFPLYHRFTPNRKPSIAKSSSTEPLHNRDLEAQQPEKELHQPQS